MRIWSTRILIKKIQREQKEAGERGEEIEEGNKEAEKRRDGEPCAQPGNVRTCKGKKNVLDGKEEYNKGEEGSGAPSVNTDGRRCTTVYMTTHWQPWAGGAYGSSPRPTGPHTDGTRWSLVDLQYWIKLALASLTRTRGRARSSLRRWLCSINLLSLSSDMDCLWGRELIAVEWVKEIKDCLRRLLSVQRESGRLQDGC